MKKLMALVFMFCFFSGFGVVDAAVAEVVVVGDVGSFSGAVLRVVSPLTGEEGDKIYASEYLTQAGVIKFDVETGLDEIDLKIVVTKGGQIVEVIEEGPFAMDGSRITLDRRDGVNRSEVIEEEVVEVIEEVVSLEDNSSELDNETVDLELEEAEVVEVVEVDDKDESVVGIFLTGKSIFVKEDGTLRVGSSVGGMLLVLMLVVFVFMGHRRVHRKKKIDDVLGEDDKELAYMEKKVRETESKISKIKGEREKKAKLSVVRAKLAKEERELRNLEKEEGRKSEKVESL